MSDDDKATTTRTALAPASRSRALLTSSDLDDALEDVRTLFGEGAVNFWRLGKRLLDINERQLWKLRTDENGRRLHNSFDAFVAKEIGGVSVSRAYEMIDVARHFTEDAAREYGSTKCVLLLRAAPEDRPALAASAKTSTTRQLAAAAKESRETRGYTKPSQQAAAGRASRAKQTSTTKPPTVDAAPVRRERITVAIVDGVKRAKLYQRPASLVGVAFESLPRARSLDDQPCGELVLANGVRLLVAVVRDKNGDLMLAAEAARGGDDGGVTVDNAEDEHGDHDDAPARGRRSA